MNNISVVQSMTNYSASRAVEAQASTSSADDVSKAHASPESTSVGLMQPLASVVQHEVVYLADAVKGDKADMKTGVANITKKAIANISFD